MHFKKSNENLRETCKFHLSEKDDLEGRKIKKSKMAYLEFRKTHGRNVEVLAKNVQK